MTDDMPEDTGSTLSTSASDNPSVATGDIRAPATDEGLARALDSWSLTSELAEGSHVLSSPMPDASLPKGEEGNSHDVSSPLPRRGIEEEEGEGEGVEEGEGEGERQDCVWLQCWPM